MKTIKRILASVVSVAMMATFFVACSAKTTEQDVVGDWTVSTINGMTREAYAESVGARSLALALNLKFEAEKVTISNVYGYLEHKINYTADGVDILKDDNVVASISFNKDTQTLKANTLPAEGVTVEYVFVKGTTDLSDWGLPPDTSGMSGSDYGERTEEDMMRDEMNDGLTGADYGERSEEELEREEMNNGLTGADYGERTEAEMAADDARASANASSNNNSNSNSTNTVANTTNNNSNLTGRDYGERTEEDMMQDDMNNGYTGRDYGELTEEEMREIMNDTLTGRDYGERTEEDMMHDEMNAGLTGRDYGEGEL